jgi:hypothetical protein
LTFNTNNIQLFNKKFWIKMSSILIKLSIILILVSLNSLVESRKDKIKLKDIQVLTLTSGKWTTGRRTNPLPQLQCVGGYCNLFKPQTVQCYNRGSDGIDIQWECKTEMDNKYKFGQIDVLCEGYDYPEDDYVLIGSCGLEYTIDLVNTNSNNNYQQNYDKTYRQEYKPKISNSFSFGYILCVGFIIFVIYYTCLRPNSATTQRDNRSSAGSPPPPGFRSDFSDDKSGRTSSDYSTHDRSGAYNANANTGNGFMTGLFTGGTLGYLFGSRTNPTNYSDQSSYFGRRASPPPSYFSSSSPSGSSSSSSPSTSKTTSGFGGTKRR